MTQPTDRSLPHGDAFGAPDGTPGAGGTTRDVPRVLVLDFDGTICLGDAPVWAYAEAVIEALSEHGPAELRSGEAIRGQLAAFLHGAPHTPRYLDGYAAVASISNGMLTDRQRQRAYRASREFLAAGTLDTHAPPGLADLLADLADQAHRVVVTNAPAAGVGKTLGSLGLGDLIDEIITDADKPAGWGEILPKLIAHRDPIDVMAIGDVWANDIEPPLSAGCCTALVDRFGQRPGPAHLIGRTLPELYPAIRRWAADPSSFVRSHQPHSTDPTAAAAGAAGATAATGENR